MESGTNDIQSARDGLADIDEGRRATAAGAPLSPWFLPALAGLVAAVFLGQLLPTVGAIAVALVAAAAIGALAGAEMHRTGVVTSVRRSPNRLAGTLCGVAMGLLVAAAAVLDQVAGWPAAWAVGAVLAAGAILTLGRLGAPRP